MTAIKRKDIFGKKVFTEPQEEAEDLLKTLDLIQETLKKTAKQAAEFAKGFKVVDSNDIKAFNEALSKSKKAVSDLDKFEKQRIATIKKLNEANSDRIQDITELQVQLQEQRKVNKQIAKENLGLVSAYQKESKRLNDLRKEYKDLAVQNKENTKEGKALLKNITQLDKKLKDVDETVGQNQRSVGDYKTAVEGLNSTLGKLGIVAIIAKGFDLLKDAFGDTREGALALQIAFSKFTESARVFINNVIDAGSGVKDLFSAIFDSVESLGLKTERAFLKIQLASLELLNKNPLADYSQEISILNNELNSLNDQIKDLEESSVSDSIDKIAQAFQGTTETASRAIDAQEKFLKLQLETRIEIERQEKALAGLAEKRQILQDISDDDTIGFVTRAEAVQKAQKAAEEFAELELKLALTREKLAFTAIKQDLIRADISVKSLEAQENQADKSRELIRLLEQNNIARKVSDENDEAFTAAFIERRNKQVEAEAFARDQEEKNRKTARDSFEQQLDIIEEFTEKRISTNEQVINSDKASLDQRRSALLENQKLESELFEESIDLILKQGKASLDLRKDLTDAEKEQQKELLNRQAIQQILNEQDAEEQFNLIRKLNLGEIEEKRLKETLKIKKETAEINKESLKVEEEAARKTKELNEDISLQEKVLAGELVDLENERIENEKKNLQERIDLLEKDSIERLELEKELNDKLIDEQEKTKEQQEKIREEQISEAQNLANELFDIVTNSIKKQDDARSESLDNEIEQQQALINKLRQNAVEGSEKALAFEEAQLEKQRLARERAAEKAARKQRVLELAQIFLNQVAEQTKENPDTAIAEAFKNTFLAEAIAQGISGFYEGTENVAKSLGKPDVKGKDGYIIRVDGQERILNPSQNASIPSGMSNEELVRAAQEYQAGNTWSFMPKVTPVQNINNIDLSEVVASNDRVVKAIQDNKVEISNDYHGLHEWIETRIKKGQKEIIKHMLKR